MWQSGLSQPRLSLVAQLCFIIFDLIRLSINYDVRTEPPLKVVMVPSLSIVLSHELLKRQSLVRSLADLLGYLLQCVNGAQLKHVCRMLLYSSHAVRALTVLKAGRAMSLATTTVVYCRELAEV